MRGMLTYVHGYVWMVTYMRRCAYICVDANINAHICVHGHVYGKVRTYMRGRSHICTNMTIVSDAEV